MQEEIFKDEWYIFVYADGTHKGASSLESLNDSSNISSIILRLKRVRTYMSNEPDNYGNRYCWFDYHIVAKDGNKLPSTVIDGLTVSGFNGVDDTRKNIGTHPPSLRFDVHFDDIKRTFGLDLQQKSGQWIKSCCNFSGL
jgi:hypothetical protein